MRRTIYYGFLIFLFCVLVGFVYSRLWYNLNYKLSAENIKSNINNIGENKVETIETSDIDEKVSPNAYFALKKYYGECGHYDIQYAELPIELINLNKEKVNGMYEGWNVEEFSKNLVVLCTEIQGLCDEHYIVKLEDGYIKVYNLEKDEKFKLYKQTEITKEYLTEEDVKILEEGLNVYGKGTANAVLEDFE